MKPTKQLQIYYLTYRISEQRGSSFKVWKQHKNSTYSLNLNSVRVIFKWEERLEKYLNILTATYLAKENSLLEASLMWERTSIETIGVADGAVEPGEGPSSATERGAETCTAPWTFFFH